MIRPLLFVTRILPEPVMARIHQKYMLVREPQEHPLSHAQLCEGIRKADAMICTLTDWIDQSVVDCAHQLRVIANYAVGFNNITLAATQKAGIVVTNTPDVLTETTADLTWALLLATARRLTEGHHIVQSGKWKGWAPTQLLGTEVHGRRLGIIGMGRIGQAVARRAKGFNMSISYCSRSPLPSTSETQHWRTTSLDQLLGESDFLSLHVPLTAETRHLLGTKELERVQSTAILINTSRGPLIDEGALVEALQKGRLAGAGLDVYEHEPSLHPLLAQLPQVITLPHIGSATMAARVKMGLICLDNIEAVMEGRQAPNAVQQQ